MFYNDPSKYCWIKVLKSDFDPNVDSLYDRPSTDSASSDFIQFQFMPGVITDSKQALYQDYTVIGRSAPIKAYSFSSARTISFMLEFYAYPEAGSAMSPRLIRKKIDGLRALIYPEYSQTTIMPPRKCLIRIANQLSMVGVCKQYTVNYSNQYPWVVPDQKRLPTSRNFTNESQIDSSSLRAINQRLTRIQRTETEDSIGFTQYATISLAFEEIASVPESYEEVLEGAPSLSEEGEVSTSSEFTVDPTLF